MTHRDDASAARRNRPWPVVVRSIREEPADEWGTMTSEERVALVWTLSARMWELTGRPFPSYKRSEMPVRIRRRQ
jgi:hypothetical protein